jgi:ribosome-binding factor A
MFNAPQESRRSRKVADQIKNELGWIIQQKYKNAQQGMVTLTKVKLSRDLKYATIYFTAMGDDVVPAEAEKALKKAVSFLRRELSQKLALRFVPELRFFYDESLAYSQHIASLFKKIDDDKDNQ